MRIGGFAARVVGLLGLLAALNAGSAPITFIHSGFSGGGELDGVPFGPSAFTITATGDTDLRSDVGGGVYVIEHITATIEIDGVGLLTFVTPTSTFVNPLGPMVGFSRGADLFDGPMSPAFATWDMLTSIGPIVGEALLFQWDLSFGAVETSAGILVFAEASSANSSFQAIVAQAPEPFSLALMGTGLALLGLRRRPPA